MNKEKLTWGPNDDQCHLGLFRSLHVAKTIPVWVGVRLPPRVLQVTCDVRRWQEPPCPPTAPASKKSHNCGLLRVQELSMVFLAPSSSAPTNLNHLGVVGQHSVWQYSSFYLRDNIVSLWLFCSLFFFWNQNVLCRAQTQYTDGLTNQSS